MANTNEAVNVIVKNVEFYWAKLSRPVEPFGELQWELQIRFPKSRVEEMEQYGKVKPVVGEKNVFSLNLKKKAIKADGTPAQPIEVVGTKQGEVIDPRTIGNGSKGNVKLMLREYSIKKGAKVTEGTSVMLTKVQVTELVMYTPKSTNDFDFDDDEALADPKGKAQKLPKGKKQAEDEIPF